MSFSAYLLNVGADSSYLNPPNNDQGAINTYLGKPVRFIGRAVWGIGSSSVGGVCGVAYHTLALLGSILRCDCLGKPGQARIFHHFMAVLEDVAAVALVACPIILIEMARFIAYARFLPVQMRILSLAGAGLQLGTGIYVSRGNYFWFTGYPDECKKPQLN